MNYLKKVITKTLVQVKQWNSQGIEYKTVWRKWLNSTKAVFVREREKRK